MKLTDLLTPELYRRWHCSKQEIPGLLKQRTQRLEPLIKEFDNCILQCGRPSTYNKLSIDELELAMTTNMLIIIDQMIELATEPKHGSN